MLLRNRNNACVDKSVLKKIVKKYFFCKNKKTRISINKNYNLKKIILTRHFLKTVLLFGKSQIYLAKKKVVLFKKIRNRVASPGRPLKKLYNNMIAINNRISKTFLKKSITFYLKKKFVC